MPEDSCGMFGWGDIVMGSSSPDWTLLMRSNQSEAERGPREEEGGFAATAVGDGPGVCMGLGTASIVGICARISG